MITGNADLEGGARRQGHSHLQCGDVGGAARRLAGSRGDDAATDSGARACKRRRLGWTQTNRCDGRKCLCRGSDERQGA